MTNPAPFDSQRGVVLARRTSVIGLGFFLAILTIPGVYQAARGLSHADVARWREWLAREPTSAAALRRIESDFDARFLFGRTIRGELPSRIPGLRNNYGVAGTVDGVGDWIFLAVDAQVPRAVGFMNARLDAPTRARLAFADSNAQLKARGIHLLVVPIPAKASIYPDKLDATYQCAGGPDLNSDHAAWFDAMRADGIDTLDLTDALWAERARELTEPDDAAFSPSDSHWTYHGMRIAADQIASRLKPDLTQAPKLAGLHEVTLDRALGGDLQAMVANEAGGAGRNPTTMMAASETRRFVLDSDGRPVACNDANAPILLLGDSFAALHNDDGSGLASALMAATGVRVYSDAVIGGTATSMRQPLSKDPQALRHARVVVLAFSIRHLISMEWLPMSIDATSGVRRDDAGP